MKAASIVWWDWSERGNCGEKVYSLTRKWNDDFNYDGIVDDLHDVLIRFGYPEEDATRRSRLPAASWQRVEVVK